MSNTYVITSPYLIPVNTNGSIVYSIFHDKEFFISSTQKNILLLCKSKQSYINLVNHFSIIDIHFLLNNQLLFNVDTLWMKSNIKYAEIEINSNCNYRCEYCPNSQFLKPAHFMETNVFTCILNKLKQLGTVEYITLHSYNEPCLDPLFLQRLDAIKACHMRLDLFTNASQLTEKYITCLKNYKILRTLKINLPSLDKNTFIRMTGYPHFEKVIENINKAINAELNIQIICNGTSQDFSENYESLTAYFKPLRIQVIKNSTNDRAGAITNKYAMNYHNNGILTGCNQVLTWLHFNYQGDIYLCCMDYSQKYKYANIQENSLEQILASESFQTMRKQVFGILNTPQDFLCRKCWNNVISRQYREKCRLYEPDFPKQSKPTLDRQ